MLPATRSIWPWFTHPRMIPKWIGFVLMGGMTFLVAAPNQIWVYLLGILLFFV